MVTNSSLGVNTHVAGFKSPKQAAGRRSFCFIIVLGLSSRLPILIYKLFSLKVVQLSSFSEDLGWRMAARGSASQWLSIAPATRRIHSSLNLLEETDAIVWEFVPFGSYWDLVVHCAKHPTFKNLPPATAWLGFKSVVPSEISQTEKDKYCMISCVCEV